LSEQLGPSCDKSSPRCAAHSEFSARDPLCASGTLSERYWSPPDDFFSDGAWTLTCPEGSTLHLNLQFVEETPLAPGRTRVYVPWAIARHGGTGRFAGMRGNGMGVANIRYTPSATFYDVDLNGSVR
jgi:hypothetical protein